MKEAAVEVEASGAQTTQGKRLGLVVAGGSGSVRSESEKEKTKIRERQRRSITTKIFHGLRKHGGYRLSPRADINEVLRELAKEAGWVIDPDGTTYRSPKAWNCCPVCGAVKTSATPTPSGSGGGGECSTTASPRRFPVGDSMINIGGPSSLNFSGSGSGGALAQDLILDRDIPLAVYMNGGLSGCFQPSTTADTSAAVGGGGGSSTVGMMGYQQQQMYMQEARASNHNTPVGSPMRRA